MKHTKEALEIVFGAFLVILCIVAVIGFLFIVPIAITGTWETGSANVGEALFTVGWAIGWILIVVFSVAIWKDLHE